MNIDRPLEDYVQQNRHQRAPSGSNKRGGYGRGNGVRSSPYQVKRRALSANAVPTAPRGNSSAAWKHDLFPNSNGAKKGGKGKEEIITFPKEEIIQFPPRRLSQKEKNDLLQANPLYQRLDAPNSKGTLFFPPATPAPALKQPPTQPRLFQAPVQHHPPPVQDYQEYRPVPQQYQAPLSIPTGPAAMKKSASTSNLHSPHSQSSYSSPPAQPISIAGTATAYVIVQNLSPAVSVADIKAVFANIGGGVKEVHIMSSTGETLKVKVAFRRPEGGRDCIANFDGKKADGRFLSVAFEQPEMASQEISIMNPQLPRPTRRVQKPLVMAGMPVNTPASSASTLYSDQIIAKEGTRKGGRLENLMMT